MATGGDSLGIEELEKDITCSICNEHYTDPKVLTCYHYYCKQCIYRHAMRTGLDKPFSCPVCSKDTTLPLSSVDKLKGAFFVNKMKQIHFNLARATGKVEAKCEMCSGTKAEAFCRQCVMFICAECIKQHQIMRVFAGHEISTLEELKEGGSKVKELFNQQPPLAMCKAHKDPMKLYCFDCSSLICRDCCVKEHLGHNYEFVTVSSPATKKKLIQQLGPLKMTRATLLRAVQEIQTTKSQVKAQTYSVTSRIEKSFDELRQIMEHRKKELIAEVTKKEAQKLEQLSNQEKGLSLKSAEAQCVTEYTAQCVEHSADDEIMCMHAELQSLIDTAIQQQQEGGKNLEPVEEADLAVEVSFVEDFKKLCQNSAKITQLPKNCTLSQQNAEVNKTCKLILKAFRANGKPTGRSHIVRAHLKSLVNGSTTQCQVESVKDGEYFIQYTPSVRGRHELTVSLNGLEVTGSPFPVFVSIHPSQLGKSVKVITGFTECRRVAVNPAGETIVADNNTISVFDKNVQKRKGRSLSDYNISYPQGVAVDNADSSIIMTDSETGSRKIVKLNPDLKQIGEVIMKKGSLVRGVAVVGNEIMVCDRDNCVMVYTKDLKYKRSLTAQGDGSGQVISRVGISPDEQGNVYISDPDRFLVHVFSNNGVFLRSFGQVQNVKVNRPFRVCVSGRYVFVSDCVGNDISVYTTDGEHVTTFGQKGEGEGDFNYPLGVCVDADGFVYVCDKFNNRVKIF